MMRRAATMLVVSALALAGCNSVLAKRDDPACAGVPDVALKGRLSDHAGLIAPADEAKITDALVQYEKATGRQMAVASIETAGGITLQNYGTCLGQRWGIGDKERNDGVVVLLFAQEREIRLSTGRGIAKILTDKEAKVIVDQMSPFFAKGDFASGLELGIGKVAADLGRVTPK